MMMKEGTLVEEKKDRQYVIPPSKFSLWLFIVSIILFFGGLTSAYIVSKGIETEKNIDWLNIPLPRLFWYTTVVMAVSSVMMQIGVWGARKGDFNRVRIALWLTLALGIVFLVGQYYAWVQLWNEGFVLGRGGSTSANYLYVLTVLHGFHILAGLAYLGIVLARTLSGVYTQGKITGIENCATFWHFLDLLWIYLFLFLLLNNG